jgi:hypothetical protein
MRIKQYYNIENEKRERERGRPAEVRRLIPQKEQHLFVPIV